MKQEYGLPGSRSEDVEKMRERAQEAEKRLREYAQEHGLTMDEAAEKIVSESELRILGRDELKPF